MSIENTNPKALWRSIQHQQVQVPNLGRLFPSWKARIHPEYEKCRDEVLNPWIRHWVDNDRTCYKLQKAEFGVFAAILCAGSSFDRMCTVAKFFAWYFIWDDIFDCGSLQGDYITMKAYREASMQYIQHQLLPETECPDLSPYSQELQKALQCWEEVGSHIRSVCSSDTCIVLSKEIVDYIAAVDDANALFMDGTVPSVQEYWRRRDFTAGVYPTIATIPFAHGVDVNLSDISNPRMQDLWKSTSYLVHITNDILSLRKELKDGQIENIVPVLMLNKGLTMNQAIQESYNLANQNALGIDTATQALKSELPGYYDPVVNALTQGCTDIAAGLIHWSYSGERYFKQTELDANGVFHFQINKSAPATIPLPSNSLSKSPTTKIPSLRASLFVLGSGIALLSSGLLVFRAISLDLGWGFSHFTY